MRLMPGAGDGAGANLAKPVEPVVLPNAKKSSPQKAGDVRLQAGKALSSRVLVGSVVILLGVLALAGVFTVALARNAAEVALKSRGQATARAVAAAVEPLVQGDQITELRRLVTDVTEHADGLEVSVTLPDGSVLAHSDPSRINVRQLPATWSAAMPEGGSDGDSVTEALTIKRRGPLLVNVHLPGHSASAELVQSLSILLISSGLVGVTLLVLVLRGVNKPLRSLALISQALREVHSCKGDLGLLRMDERFGPEAVAFNELLTAAAGRRDNDAQVAPAAPVDVESTSADGTKEHSSDLEQAVNIIPTGIIILDRAGVVKRANNMGAILAGSTVAEITGQTLSQILSDEPILELLLSLREGRMTRRTIEVRRQTAVGEAVLRVQCRGLRKDDAGAALITLEDITQQRVADASRGLFVAQATHELRTPLTNMRLALETVMEDEAELPPAMAPHLNMLSGEVRRLERIVGEMLAVSEIEAGSIKLARGSIQIERLLAEIEADHRPHAVEHGLTLTFSLPPKYPQVFGDRDKLGQALQNLVGNAIKYTPTGGSVTVTICESADGKQLQFMVADTGFGISTEDQAKLFSRFGRGSDPRVAKIVGTGLGLALSREIARLHGGDITIQSELNKGSTFTLGIPLGRPEQKGELKAAA